MTRTVETYGLTVPGSPTQADIELMLAFNPRLQSASGFLGRAQHFRNATDLLWNVPRRRLAAQRGMKDYDERVHDAFIWSKWSDQLVEGYTEWHWGTTVTGPNASSKTTTTAVYADQCFYASPQDTAVVLTSTTLPGLRRRVWKEVTKFHRASGMAGVFQIHSSDYAIRYQKGSDESGIFGIATGDNEGDIEKAINRIIGFHARRVLVVVDEMQATHEAIVKACISLEAGTEWFQFIGLGNADDPLDAHGQMSAPADGRSFQEVFGQERWDTKVGICIHLNGLESPRVEEGDQYYPGLLKQSDIDNTKRDHGEDSPEFWSKRIGFWAPQGVTKTVLTVSDVNSGSAKDNAIWESGFHLGAGLDPAFEGGDRCILRIGKAGTFTDGKTGVELTEIIPVKLSATSPLPIHYQIAHFVRDACMERNIGPDMFALDTTGEGGGLASIIMQEWSHAITHVEFGGKPSDRPISPNDKKPANTEYLNKVTELWFWFRILVRNGLVRGLDAPTMLEFCQRRYEMRGNLKMVEPKSDMKRRTKRSPDLADATVVLCELFRQREKMGVETSPHALSSMTQWRELARKYSVASDYLVGAS